MRTEPRPGATLGQGEPSPRATVRRAEPLPQPPSEPEGRGAAWTEERATQERATREGGASGAPRRRAGKHSEPEERGAAWTEERATQERATREGGASRAPRRRAGKHSEPEGRGAAWTEERATQERATREGGASRAPRRRAGKHSEPEGRGAARRPAGQTPFGIADELSCYYDAPSEPCNVHLEVRVAGRLDEPALRLAIRAALAEQPRALVRRARGGRWQRSYAWEVPGDPDLDPLSVTTWADDRELAQRRMRFLAAAPLLDSSPPVRLLLAAGPGGDCLILNAHHAALDGISCLELLRGIARHYGATAAAAGSATVPATEPAAADVVGPARPPARARGMLPRPAARIAAEVASGRDGYGFELITCERVPRMPDAGPGPRATVNDLLIAALIVAIGRWNAAHGRPPGRIRITMPVNARAPGQAGTAGNLSRLTAVTARPPGRGGDVRPLAADVAAQTVAAKNRPGPQVDPLSRALAAAWCPAAVKRRLLRLALRTAGPLICDTSLVTNLGIVAEPPRFGAAPATSMWFSTSAHMPRGLSVGAITLAGRLHLCLRYRHALFSAAAAARFAGSYAAALSEITSQEVDSDRQH